MAEKLATLRKCGGGMTETVLWTNPSTSSDFAYQEVNLSQDIDNFDYLKFEYQNSTATITKSSVLISVSEFKQTSVSVPQKACFHLGWAGGTATSISLMWRPVGYVNDTKVIIGTCILTSMTSLGNQIYNLACIPTKIYGVKK